jgi:hypothetical protein
MAALTTTGRTTPPPTPMLRKRHREEQPTLLIKKPKAEVKELFDCAPATKRPMYILVPFGTPANNPELTPELSALQSDAQLEEAQSIEFNNFMIELKKEIRDNLIAILAKSQVKVSENNKDSLIDIIAKDFILYYDPSLTAKALVQTAINQEDVWT